jgi:hypothetical protein
MRSTHKYLFGKSEGKRVCLGGILRWEDSINSNLREVEYEGVDWINLAQERNQWQALVNTVMKSNLY